MNNGHIVMARQGIVQAVPTPNVYESFHDFSDGLGLTPLMTSARNVLPVAPAGVVAWGGEQAGRMFVSTDAGLVRPGKSHVLALRYPPTALWTELNTSLGTHLGGAGGFFEMEWWMRVTPNFLPAGPGTSKIFQFWEATYTSRGFTGISVQGIGGGAWQVLPVVTNRNGEGAGPSAVASYPSLYGNRFIAPLTETRGALLPGQWHKLRFRVTHSTRFDATDGRWELWIDDAIFARIINCNIWSYDSPTTLVPNVEPSRAPAYNAGYLMGYSNNGFVEDTVFYWSDITYRGTIASEFGWSPPYVGTPGAGGTLP